MTREVILRRLDELQAKRQQLMSDIQAYTGAIQDCEFWLAIVDKETKDGERSS